MGIFSRLPQSVIALLLAVWLLCLSGCGEEESYTPTALNLAVSESFENSFNYFYAERDGNRLATLLAGGSLVQPSADGGYEPYLGNITAEKQGDTLLVTVSIQEGLRFANGKYARIDDLLFLYQVLADPGYTGCYSNFWQSPITGLAAYYWDDPAGISSVPDFEAEAEKNYAPDVISEEDLKTYLIETKLDGAWNGNLDSSREGIQTWRQYIEAEGYGEQLAEVSSSAVGTLRLLADLYYENYASQYDATEWYARKLRREFMEQTLTDGVDVPEISGIRRVDDYSCTVEFYDTSADYVEILNRPLLYADSFTSLQKGQGDSVVSNPIRSSISGAGPYNIVQYEDKILTMEANRYFVEGRPDIETLRLRYVESSQLPVNCHLRQVSVGYVAEPSEELLEQIRRYELSTLSLADGGILLYNAADVDLSQISASNKASRFYYYNNLYRCSL